MRTMLIALVLATSSVAAADTATVVEPAPARDRGQLLVAPKLGVVLPYGFSKLGASYLVGLEVGYVLPVVRHHLAVTLEGAFTAPEASGATSDPRLDAAAGSYTWHLAQREGILGVSLVYRHPLAALGGRLLPYVGVGPRLFLLDSRVSGSAGGATIAQSSETSTKVGAGIAGGVGYHVGPGEFFAEVRVDVAAIDHRTTGDSNTGSLSLAAGYRFGL